MNSNLALFVITTVHMILWIAITVSVAEGFSSGSYFDGGDIYNIANTTDCIYSSSLPTVPLYILLAEVVINVLAQMIGFARVLKGIYENFFILRELKVSPHSVTFHEILNFFFFIFTTRKRSTCLASHFASFHGQYSDFFPSHCCTRSQLPWLAYG